MPQLFIFCGIPGSGKTTLSIQFAINHNAKIYHYDDFKKETKQQAFRQVHQKLYEIIIKDLLERHNVVLDDLYVCLEWRQELLNALQNIPCKKILIVMTTPLEECVRRNAQREGQARLPDSVIYHLNQRYQPPSLEEGWDEILYY